VRPLRGGFDGWKKAGYPLFEYAEESRIALTGAMGTETLLKSA
jgi:3-mercaptopyruvate sulfurtransferase SseA